MASCFIEPLTCVLFTVNGVLLFTVRCVLLFTVNGVLLFTVRCVLFWFTVCKCIRWNHIADLMYIVGCVCVGVNQIGTVLGVNLVIGYWSLSNVYNWLCVYWC